MMLSPDQLRFESHAFQALLARALGMVRLALAGSRQPYVAFTSGKDSVATAGLVHAVRPDVTLFWSDDELEYPEVITYMTDLQHLAGQQLVIAEGWACHANWFWPWRDRPSWREPLPSTQFAGMDADDWMARRGHDLTFTGVRMEESRRRRDWLISAGPLYRVTRGTGRRCCPLWDWSADDVWALIEGWGLAVSPVYARLEEIGVQRIAQRVGPLPLARHTHLLDGWPDLLTRLDARYGRRWA